MIWKARYIACSNCQAWRLCEALWISEARNLARFECYQLQYSLVVRDIEQELVPLCLHKGLGIVAWGPLASGWRLDGDVLVRLNKVSHLPERYPESFEKNVGERRIQALSMPSL